MGRWAPAGPCAEDAKQDGCTSRCTGVRERKRDDLSRYGTRRFTSHAEHSSLVKSARGPCCRSADPEPVGPLARAEKMPTLAMISHASVDHAANHKNGWPGGTGSSAMT